MSALAPTVQAFFTQRLLRERNASPHTIAAYRDTIKLLLRFAATRCGREPSMLDVADLDADTVAAFLDHLQTDRGNSARTRNAQAGGDPFALPICRAAPSRARPRHPTRALDPTETHRPSARHVPRPAGDRSAARRARSHDLDRPTRPRAAPARDPDRAARLRADHAQRRRRSTRRRRTRDVRRERTQTEDHAAHPDDQRGDPRLARRTRRQPRRPAVPDDPRPTADPRRARTTPRDPPRARRPASARACARRTSRCTRSGITWTAELCGRLGLLRWWTWRWGRFRPHNPGGVRVNDPSGRIVRSDSRLPP